MSVPVDSKTLSLSNDLPSFGDENSTTASHPSSSPRIFHEHIGFGNIQGSYAIIAEHWPSWLSALFATGTTPSMVYSSNIRQYRSMFHSVYSGPWSPLSHLSSGLLRQYDYVFVSGSLSYVSELFSMLPLQRSYVLFDGVQPNKRRLSHLPLNWTRYTHYNCGGVTSGRYWCGTPTDLALLSVAAPPIRLLWESLNPAARVPQSKVSPPSSEETFLHPVCLTEGVYHANGLYPIAPSLSMIHTPSVFTSTGWCKRRLLPSEIAHIYDQPGYILSQYPSQSSTSTPLAFTSGIPLKIPYMVLRRCGFVLSSPLSSVPHSIPISVEVPPDFKPEYQAAVKHDDARIETEVWDNRVLSHFDLSSKSHDFALSTGLPRLRRRFTLEWQKRVRRSFFRYLAAAYGSDWQTCSARHDPTSNLSQDILAFADCFYYVRHTTWFEWPAGSRLLFWRWHPSYITRARDGVPLNFVKVKPRSQRPQQAPESPTVLEQIRAKLAKVRRRNYIAPGFVRSLIRYFAVPKGESDIRLVYDGTSSGFNDSIWVPSFGMTTIDSVLGSVDTNTWMGDIDVADQFLNFPLHANAQPYCGVDLSPYFEEELKENKKGGFFRLFERWTRCLMGAKSSPYLTIQAMIWAEDYIRGDRKAPSNPFRWDFVELNLPGSSKYDPTRPWVSKRRSDGTLASDFFSYVDDLRSTSPSLEEAWQVLQRISSILGYLGIQDAARKRRPPTQRPGVWAGSMVYVDEANVGVYLSHDKWIKVKTYLSWIKEECDRCQLQLSMPTFKKLLNWGINHKELEKKHGYLVYASRTYPSMTPYLKGIHHTLDSWREGRDHDGWKLTNNELRGASKLSEGVDYTYQKNAPPHVFPVPRLHDDIECLLSLFESENPKVRFIRSKFVTVVLYGFGDASGEGFGATIQDKTSGVRMRYGIWGRDRNTLTLNYRELANLVETIELEAEQGLLSGTELFIFTDNSVAESCFYKGTSSTRALFDLVLRLRKLQLKYSLRLYFIHVAGTQMIKQGTDGISRGNFLEGVLIGQDMLSFIPLHQSALDRSSLLLDWFTTWCKETPTVLTPDDWYTLGHGITGGKPNLDGEWQPVYDNSLKLWSPAPTAAFQAMAELIKSRHMNPSTPHIFVCPRLFTHAWRKSLMKFADLCFYVPVGFIDAWPKDMHEPLMIGVFLPFSNRKPWQLKNSPEILEVERNLRGVWKNKNRCARSILCKLWNLEVDPI